MQTLFNNYTYFLAIVDTGNITKAAESLYIAQPSLTQYLKQLEKTVGARLINRDTTPLSLTDAGEVYYRYALEYARLVGDFEKELSPFCTDIQGVLKLGLPITLQPFFTKDLILPFTKLHPSVRVSMNGSTSPTLERMTANGAISASIIHVRKENYANLTYRLIKNDPVVIVCNPTHPLVRGRESSIDRPIPVSLSEIRDELFYLMEPSFILRQAPDEVFRRAGIVPKHVIQMSNIDTTIALCAEGGEGLAFITNSFYYMFKGTEKLAFLTLKEEPLLFRFVLCTRKDDASPQTKAFADYVETRINLYH